MNSSDSPGQPHLMFVPSVEELADQQFAYRICYGVSRQVDNFVRSHNYDIQEMLERCNYQTELSQVNY